MMMSPSSTTVSGVAWVKSSPARFTPTMVMPYLGAVLCAFLAGPWARDAEQREQYTIAAYLLVIGVVLWIIAYLTTRNSTDKTVDRDLSTLEE